MVSLMLVSVLDCWNGMVVMRASSASSGVVVWEPGGGGGERSRCLAATDIHVAAHPSQPHHITRALSSLDLQQGRL